MLQDIKQNNIEDVSEAEQITSYQAVTAIISTRNRADSLTEAVASILANTYPEFELIVVDQSDDDTSRLALQPFMHDHRLRYIASQEQGVSKGRNLAIEQARYELIAITDDDCVVPETWLQQMAQCLLQHPYISMIFGNVLPGECDYSQGFIPTYICLKSEMLHGPKQKKRLEGLGACMAVTRSAWQNVHGFDPFLGAGGVLQACEEGDLAHKIMLSGGYIYITPDVSVIHNGFRTFRQGRKLAHRNYFGTGAWAAKHVKLRHWSILSDICHVITKAIGYVWDSIIQRHRISGITPFFAFGQGFIKGLTVPVNQQTGNYATNSTHRP